MKLPDAGAYGAGIIFLPMDKAKQAMAIEFTEKACAGEGWDFLGWRDVPVNPDVLGDLARRVMPYIRQFFVKKDGLTGIELERKLYILRKVLSGTGIGNCQTVHHGGHVVRVTQQGGA